MGGVFTVPACWLPEYKPVMGMEDSIVWPFLIPSAGKDILQESPFLMVDIKKTGLGGVALVTPDFFSR
jgi:hypothetical protein